MTSSGSDLYRIIRFIGKPVINNFKKYYPCIFTVILILLYSHNAIAQYPWPVEPKNQSHELTGTFCEFRDTGTSDHFHNAVDIPKADGSPVYAIADGQVTSIVRTGSNAYVRVGRYCYLHITPRADLQVGDAVVTEQTILGTILSGMGHIHFIDGYYNSEINPIRANGGLTPYDDPWAPQIQYVKFYQDQTEIEFSEGKVSGRVDIIVKVKEKNGPPSTYESRLNNGTYYLAYKILNDDADSVVFSPSYYYRFDNKPSNSNVHNVFFKSLSSTSSHVYIATNEVYRNRYWDTTQFPPGDYTVMVNTFDTRQNTDTVYVPIQILEQDVTPPESPELKYIRQVPGGFKIAWYPNTEDDLAAYNLYYSRDNSNWQIVTSGSEIPPDSTSKTFSIASFYNALYFKVTAIDSAAIPNESEGSDVYGIKLNSEGSSNLLLIVDGFDRNQDSGGAWSERSHSFGFTYGEAVSQHDFLFDMCNNDALIDGSIHLDNYQAVIWFLGDEAELNETFSQDEQAILADFLSRYGKIFLTGSNIAWDLDLDSDCYSTTQQDNDFLNQTLRANYEGKSTAQVTVSGRTDDIFSGFEFNLDQQILSIDSIDVISPVLPGRICLQYDSTRYAGVINDDLNDGRLLYFAFPFEMISSSETRAELMYNILAFLFVIDSVENPEDSGGPNVTQPQKFTIEQNYPNPFDFATKIRFNVPYQTTLSLKIYNVLGQSVRTVKNQSFKQGSYESIWDGRNDAGKMVPNGLYFYVLETNNIRISKKLLLLGK